MLDINLFRTGESRSPPSHCALAIRRIPSLRLLLACWQPEGLQSQAWNL